MSDFLKNLKGFRTLIVQGVVALAGILVAFGVIPASDMAGITTENVASQFDAIVGSIAILLAAINSVLRLFTTTPLGVNDK